VQADQNILIIVKMIEEMEGIIIITIVELISIKEI